MRTVLILAATIAVLLVGCGPQGTAVSSGSGGISVGDTKGTYFAHRDGGMLLVIWVKHPNGASGGGGSGTNSSAAETILTGHYQYGDGPKVDWKCETKDGRGDTVNVVGKSYELSNGGLFLIDLCGQDPVVSQLRRDLSKIRNQKELEALATTDADVKDDDAANPPSCGPRSRPARLRFCRASDPGRNGTLSTRYSDAPHPTPTPARRSGHGRPVPCAPGSRQCKRRLPALSRWHPTSCNSSSSGSNRSRYFTP